jgi:hypothetical protein
LGLDRENSEGRGPWGFRLRIRRQTQGARSTQIELKVLSGLNLESSFALLLL